ncbi:MULTISPECIES: hypothetical protein [Paenibacillus]|uniref:hypothetical protein n=1 Tax=Paenibacillus TaxID=44249 RepID=UPI0015C2FF21|nr:hypothetical protein [Paenibacillus odorifer]
MTDILYAIQQQQLQRTYGELNGLLALHYDPMKGRTTRYDELDELIERFINDMGNMIG